MRKAKSLFKVGRISRTGDADGVPHQHANTFEWQDAKGTPRLIIGAADSPIQVLRLLASSLSEPFLLLFILQLTRRGNVPGRYQSPPLGRDTLEVFLGEFGKFLNEDARHELWLHSPEENSTLVLDEHNFLYAYGPLGRFQEILLKAGFRDGAVEVPTPHSHHYHVEFDEDESALLKRFAWKHFPLRPEDD